MDHWYNHIYSHTYYVAGAILVGAVLWRRLSFFAKLVWGLVLVNVIIDVFATYLNRALGYYTTTLYSIYSVIEFIAIFLFYTLFFNNLLYRVLVYSIGVGFVVFAIINFVLIQGIDDFNTYSYTAGGIIISGLSYLLLRKLIISDENPIKNIMVWFAAVNFIYYLVSIPVLSLSSPYFNIPNDFHQHLLKIKDAAYILWSFIISIGFICQEKKTI